MGNEHLKPPRVVRKLTDLRRWVAAERAAGLSIALVPTMGALHAGHQSLVRLASKKASRVVASIFVNPTQFAPHEDFGRYPRDEDGDRVKLGDAGCDLVWAPTADVMYPEGFATRIAPQGAAQGLETDFRPHFFGGVATVVAKLFNQVRPDIAVFGEKDFQQLAVIRQLVRDLDFEVKIIGAPTMREKDGLAMSSRNAYLTEEERRIAPALHAVIREVAAKAKSGGMPSALAIEATARLMAAGFGKVDYVEVRDAETLGPYDARAGRKGRVLAAAWLDRTRLIDNVAV